MDRICVNVASKTGVSADHPSGTRPQMHVHCAVIVFAARMFAKILRLFNTIIYLESGKKVEWKRSANEQAILAKEPILHIA